MKRVPPESPTDLRLFEPCGTQLWITESSVPRRSIWVTRASISKTSHVLRTATQQPSQILFSFWDYHRSVKVKKVWVALPDVAY